MHLIDSEVVHWEVHGGCDVHDPAPLHLHDPPEQPVDPEHASSVDPNGTYVEPQTPPEQEGSLHLVSAQATIEPSSVQSSPSESEQT